MDNNEYNVDYCRNFVQNLTEDMSAKIPPIDESKLVNNPFSQELVVEATRYVDEGIIIDDNGEKILASHLIEKQKYTKLYHIAGGCTKAMALSSGALRMFVFIAYHLDGTKDYLRITPENYNKKTQKGSLNTYKRAIMELVDECYITPTIFKNWYWINPVIFFGGSRINKFKNKVKVINDRPKAE